MLCVCVCRTLNTTLWVGSIWNNLRFLSYMCTHTHHTHYTQELVTYYQHNSLGSSFPGVDTALRFPYKDVADGGAGIDRSRPRSSYNPPPSLPPPSLPPPPIPQVTASPLQPMWADVLFTFTAEFSGELTIEVRSPYSAPCAL